MFNNKNQMADLSMIPEGGDALPIASASTTDELAHSSKESTTVAKLEVNVETVRYENAPEELDVETCGFGYYRIRKGAEGFQDTVLVKDAATSCALQHISKTNEACSSKHTSSLERFVLNQLKLECNDLTEITKKISSYTKDILRSLGMDRKNSVSKKLAEPIAARLMEKRSESHLELKSFESDYITQYQQLKIMKTTGNSRVLGPIRQKILQTMNKNLPRRDRISDLIDSKDTLIDPNFKTISELRSNNVIDARPNLKRVHRIYPRESITVELDSSSCSSSSVYDFLTMRNHKTPANGTGHLNSSKSHVQYPRKSFTNIRFIHATQMPSTPQNEGIKKTMTEFPMTSRLDRTVLLNTKQKFIPSRRTHPTLQLQKNIESSRTMNKLENGGCTSSNTATHTVNIHILSQKRGSL